MNPTEVAALSFLTYLVGYTLGLWVGRCIGRDHVDEDTLDLGIALGHLKALTKREEQTCATCPKRGEQ